MLDEATICSWIEGSQLGFWKTRIAPIAPDGVLDEVEGRAIVRFLRGDKSAVNGKSKEVKQVANDLREWYDMIAKDAMDAGYGDIRIENYFPREWNRQAIKDNKPEFTEKLARFKNI